MPFQAVVTFETTKGEPVVTRTEIVDSEPDTAARKAVLRALSEASRIKWESLVVVLDRTGAEPWGIDRTGGRTRGRGTSATDGNTTGAGVAPGDGGAAS